MDYYYLNLVLYLCDLESYILDIFWIIHDILINLHCHVGLHIVECHAGKHPFSSIFTSFYRF